MRIWTVLLSLVVVAAIAVNASAAGGKGGKKGGDKGKMPSPEERFKKMDTNSDGKLTCEEFVAASKERMGGDAKKAEDFWKRIAGEKKELTLDEYKEGMKKAFEGMKKKKGA